LTPNCFIVILISVEIVAYLFIHGAHNRNRADRYVPLIAGGVLFIPPDFRSMQRIPANDPGDGSVPEREMAHPGVQQLKTTIIEVSFADEKAPDHHNNSDLFDHTVRVHAA
jgi:hypothetical protein